MHQLNILQITTYPTVIDNNHESLFRSYHILNLVEELLRENTPPQVVLSILGEMRSSQNSEQGAGNDE